jgi:micrococcal nuclease
MSPMDITPSKWTCLWLSGYQAILNLTLGQAVWLERDTEDTREDQNGAVPRNLWLADGRLLNEVLVREGLAELNFELLEGGKYGGWLLTARREAINAGRGIWDPTHLCRR